MLIGRMLKHARTAVTFLFAQLIAATDRVFHQIDLTLVCVYITPPLFKALLPTPSVHAHSSLPSWNDMPDPPTLNRLTAALTAPFTQR